MSYSQSAPLSNSPSAVHKASLVRQDAHSALLLGLVDAPISHAAVKNLVCAVVGTVQQGLRRKGVTLKRTRKPPREFVELVYRVLDWAEITMPVLLVTLVYVERVKSYIEIALEKWALERVFLGALIVASKYLNDVTFKNVHWSMFSGVFGKNDVGRIEREYLAILDFKLRVSEEDILNHCAGTAAPIIHPTTTALLPSPIPVPNSSVHQHSATSRSRHSFKAGSKLIQRKPASRPPRLTRSHDGSWSRLPSRGSCGHI